MMLRPALADLQRYRRAVEDPHGCGRSIRYGSWSIRVLRRFREFARLPVSGPGMHHHWPQQLTAFRVSLGCFLAAAILSRHMIWLGPDIFTQTPV